MKVNEVVVMKPKPSTTFRTRREYDFLKYIRVAYRWALKNHDINKGELEVMLYLYSIGVFTKEEFHKYHKLYGIYEHKTFAKYLDDGWVEMWRGGTRKHKAMYTLTNKSKLLCNRMHRICVGDEKVPENPRYNKIAQKEERIDGYYMDIIQDMNREVDIKKARKED